jgi:hypothetical protein
MVAGLLVIGIGAGLLSAAVALALGHGLWAAALAYVLGGLLGAALGLAWGALWSLARRLRGAGPRRRGGRFPSGHPPL